MIIPSGSFVAGQTMMPLWHQPVSRGVKAEEQAPCCPAGMLGKPGMLGEAAYSFKAPGNPRLSESRCQFIEG